MAGAPQPGALAARLEVQQLAALATEYGLETRMLDQQQFTLLVGHPAQGLPGGRQKQLGQGMLCSSP
jgi:hypothetical protein